MKTISERARIIGSILIIIIGLLNFHLPHFLLERTTIFNPVVSILTGLLTLNLAAAVISAIGIYRKTRSGWMLGIIVVIVSLALYAIQITIGLPGLPKVWWEPSRLLAVIIEITFLLLARYR